MHILFVSIPVRDDVMETLYLTKDAKLTREGSTLLVRIPNTPKRRIPISGLRHVVVTGEAGLTTRLLDLFGKNGVRVTVLDWYGNVSGTFEPVRSPAAGRVRLAQAEHALDPEKAMFLARSFVDGAIGNMIVNLRYRSYRGNTDVDSFIEKIRKIRKRPFKNPIDTRVDGIRRQRKRLVLHGMARNRFQIGVRSPQTETAQQQNQLSHILVQRSGVHHDSK